MTTPNQPASVERKPTPAEQVIYDYQLSMGLAPEDAWADAEGIAEALAAQSNLHETQVGGREVERLRTALEEIAEDNMDGEEAARCAHAALTPSDAGIAQQSGGGE